MADDTYETVGVDYCTAHDGIRNEDAHYCDFRESAESEDCPDCGGAGVIFLNEQDEVDCPKCLGDGAYVTECELSPLYRRVAR